MRCQKCGQKIEENSRYCSFCGASQNTPGEEPDVKTGEKSTWIWVGIAVGILLIALAIGLCIHFTARNESVEDTWQSQYDLGMRFLSDGDYEQAIIAFEASIAIEPYHADVYLALADAYIGNGQSEQARETLEKAQDYVDDERIIEKLKELVQENAAEEPEEEPEKEPMEEEPIVRLARINRYDTYGDLSSWSDYVYDENNQIVEEISRYSEDDNGYSVNKYSYDEAGRLVEVQFIGYDQEGNVAYQLPFPFAYYVYDEEGKLIEEGGGEGSAFSVTYTYEGDKIVSSTEEYDTVVYEYDYFYDDSGLLTEKTGVQKTWEGEIEAEEQYHYEYDSEGQRIKEISETHSLEGNDFSSAVDYAYIPLFVIKSHDGEYSDLVMYDSEGHSIIELGLGDDLELMYDENGYLIQVISSYGSTEFIYETGDAIALDENAILDESAPAESPEEQLELTYPLSEEVCDKIFYNFFGYAWDEEDVTKYYVDADDEFVEYDIWHEGNSDGIMPDYVFMIYVNTGECSAGAPTGSFVTCRAEDYFY
jgi:tetratricopeptide (TPR) repeat protein